MIDIQWRPTDKDLRVFATAALVVAAIFATTIYVNVGMTRLVEVLAIVGVAVFVVGMIRPQLLKYVYIGLAIVAFPIGFVVGNVLLALVYYLLVTPIGLIFRLLRRDLLHRRIEPQATSYWIERPQAPPAGRYFRQF